MSSEQFGRSFLGFDFGTKRIGVAVGQTITGTASPLETLDAKQGVPDWKIIHRLIQAWHPVGLVVGMPYNMDDTEAEITKLTKKFVQKLGKETSLKVHVIDERLTSKAVKYECERLGKKMKEKNDALAACLILESFLENFE